MGNRPHKFVYISTTRSQCGPERAITKIVRHNECSIGNCRETNCVSTFEYNNIEYNTYKEAAAVAQRAISYNNNGDKKYNAGDYQGAINDYNEAIKLNGKNDIYKANKHEAQARIYITQEKYTEALIEAQKAIDLHSCQGPKNTKAEAYNVRGNTKYDAEDYQGAINDYEEAIRLSPSNKLYRANKHEAQAQIYIDQENYTEALIEAQKAIDLHGCQSKKNTKANAYNKRGNSQYSSGDYTGALIDYNEAEGLNSREIGYKANKYCAQAQIYINKKNYDAAISEAQKAINLIPNWQEYKDTKSKAIDLSSPKETDYFTKNNVNEAIENAERGIKLLKEGIVKEQEGEEEGDLHSIFCNAKKLLETAVDQGLNDPDTLNALIIADLMIGSTLVNKQIDKCLNNENNNKTQQDQEARELYTLIKSNLDAQKALFGHVKELLSPEQIETIESEIESVSEILTSFNGLEDGDRNRIFNELNEAVQRLYFQDRVAVSEVLANRLEVQFGGSNVAHNHGKYLSDALELYSVSGMDKMLGLRIASVLDQSLHNIKIIKSYIVQASPIEGIKKIVADNLGVQNNIIMKLIPILVPSKDAGKKHWVGIIIDYREVSSTKVVYIDSDLKYSNFDITQLALSIEEMSPQDYNKKITFKITQVEEQKYNNCGGELIENMSLYATESARELSQKEVMYLHSELYANNLMGLTSDINKIIPLIKGDIKVIPQLKLNIDNIITLKDISDYLQNIYTKYNIGFVDNLSYFEQSIEYFLKWNNDQANWYLKKLLGLDDCGTYRELQYLANKYNIGITVSDGKTAKEAYKKIALKTHPDKVKVANKEITADFLKAKQLSSSQDIDTDQQDLQIYTSTINLLNNGYKAIKIVDTLVDTIKAIKNPSDKNILKATIDYGYILESCLSINIGMQYISTYNILEQIHQENYQEAGKSLLIMVGYMLPQMLMEQAPVLSVATKSVILGLTTYHTVKESYNVVIDLYEDATELLGLSKVVEQILE